jgi:hypothetical protein
MISQLARLAAFLAWRSLFQRHADDDKGTNSWRPQRNRKDCSANPTGVSAPIRRTFTTKLPYRQQWTGAEATR